MDIDQQIKDLIDTALQDGTTPAVVEAIAPALQLVAAQLHHPQYYVWQNLAQQWVVTPIDNRQQPALPKHVIYAFASLRDATTHTDARDPQILALPVPVTHILLQMLVMETVDSLIFLDMPGNLNAATEVTRENFQTLIQSHLSNRVILTPRPPHTIQPANPHPNPTPIPKEPTASADSIPPHPQPTLQEAERLSLQALQLREQGQYEAAIPLAQRALEMRERLLGADHSDVATSLNNLGVLYKDQGRYSAAEPLYQRSLAIAERQLGGDHPHVALSLNNLAGLYCDQGRYNEAEFLFQRSLAIEETNLTRFLIAGSEDQKRAYITTLAATTYSKISFHLQSQPDSVAAARLALTTVLQRKGRVLDAVTDNLHQLRQRLDSEDQDLLDQLAAVRRQLAALWFGGLGELSLEVYRQRIETLTAAAEQFEVTLGQRSAEFRREVQPVTLEAVQALMPEDAALVELVWYYPVHSRAAIPTERFGSPRYAAAVLHAQGDPQWVDLGEAAVIDQAVKEFRRVLPAFRRRSPIAAARTLDETLMQPLRPWLGTIHHLLISPDSQLNLVPFAALVDERDRYLVETYTLTYLTSGRDLLRLQTQAPSRQQPVIIANPDFDHPGNSELATRASSSRGAENRRSTDSTSLKFGSLPGAAAEAAALARLLPAATLLTESQATENALKQVQSPRILHLATHGFFLSDLEPALPLNLLAGELMTAARPPVVPTTENPLLRSGLALAGFNLRQSGSEDGVLTALEAAGLDLQGTELVVLSACDTGVGEIANGEGVYGLRRALTIAGARSQLMSLWQVADIGTDALMVDYYHRLLQGEGRSEALRQAQLALRQDPQYCHPTIGPPLSSRAIGQEPPSGRTNSSARRMGKVRSLVPIALSNGMGTLCFAHPTNL